MKLCEVDKSKISPMMLQYIDIKEKNMDVILFFRLGDFYEMFFEDAYVASKELELTLTGKNAGLDERIPMCGIPYHAASIYLEKLVEKGYKVAICEQVEDPKTAKGVVKREVMQIVSSGTVMDSDALDEKSNNYIGNVLDLNSSYVICYTDLSTGEVNAKMINHDMDTLINTILSLSLNEIVFKSDFNKYVVDTLRNKCRLNVSISDYICNTDEYKYIYDNVLDERYIICINHLLSYLIDTQKRSLTHLQKVNIIENIYLNIDANSIRNLELVESLRLKSRNYSLLWLLDKTKTAMGSRMLKNWILNPLTNIEEINKRYDIISTLETELY